MHFPLPNILALASAEHPHDALSCVCPQFLMTRQRGLAAFLVHDLFLLIAGTVLHSWSCYMENLTLGFGLEAVRGGRADLEEDIFLRYGLCKVSRHLGAASIYKKEGDGFFQPRGSAETESSCAHVRPPKYLHPTSHSYTLPIRALIAAWETCWGSAFSVLLTQLLS